MTQGLQEGDEIVELTMNIADDIKAHSWLS
jgi:hypothetical protein